MSFRWEALATARAGLLLCQPSALALHCALILRPPHSPPRRPLLAHSYRRHCFAEGCPSQDQGVVTGKLCRARLVEMIQYANQGARAYIALIVCMKGSVVTSALPPAITSTALSIVLALAHSAGREVVGDLRWADQAFAIQVYAIILGFLIVTRTNMALDRYMTAMLGLQVMVSKWLDSFMQLCSFVNAHLERDIDPTVEDHLLEWRDQLAHWFSLMATFAVAALRGDEVQGVRLKEADMFKKSTHMRWSGLLHNNLTLEAATPANPKDDPGMEAPKSNAGATTSVSGFLEKTLPLGRSDESKWPHDVDKLDHRNNLEYLGTCTAEESTTLRQVHDKVLVVSGWICESITRSMLRNRPNAPEGPVCKVPPPVVSRVYQELSNGMQAYHQALMVVIVPFPFPFAQMLMYLLLGYMILAPFMVLQFTRSIIFSPILTFIGVFGYFGVDSIAKEIEGPFGEDANDLPLLRMHKDYNNTIRELLLPQPHLEDILKGRCDPEDPEPEPTGTPTGSIPLEPATDQITSCTRFPHTGPGEAFNPEQP